MLFTKKDCIRTMYDEAPNDSNVGLIGIIDVARVHKPEYQEPQYQLFRIKGGFGSSPSKMGNAVMGTYCADGEDCRRERYEFIGIANEEVTKFAEQLEKTWSKQN